MILLMLGAFGLLILLNDIQVERWHIDNDMCNATCINALGPDQYLDNYNLVHDDIVVQSSDHTCYCTIHECKNPDCNTYEIKNFYVNKTK